MSHNLLIQNEKASMFYVGEVPWHGLGTKLEKPATALEAITAAQLDWNVAKRPLFVADGHSRLKVSDRFATVRETETPAVLGVVGRSYTPIQNREAFAFFDPIVGKDAAIYHTAGALGAGEKVWILAKMPETIRIVGDDIAEKYLLLANSHDGKTCLQIQFTTVRVVCQNTLALALTEDADVKLKHHQDIHERMKDAEETLGLIHSQYEDIEEAFKEMARIQMNDHRLTEYLEWVFPMPKDSEEIVKNRITRDREWSAHLFDQGQGNRMRGVTGTLWAAMNGVTEWIDHRTTRQTPAQRLASTWFGDSYRTKAKAYAVAKDLVQQWAN